MNYLSSNINFLTSYSTQTRSLIAGKVGCSINSLYCYQNNICEPSIDTIFNFSHLFDISIDKLVKEDLKAIFIKEFKKYLHSNLCRYKMSDSTLSHALNVPTLDIIKWKSGESLPKLLIIIRLSKLFKYNKPFLPENHLFF